MARHGLTWRPDSRDLGDAEAIRQQIEAGRKMSGFNINAAAYDALERLAPGAMPWRVDLERRQAQLGTIHVDFEWLPNTGVFWLTSYRRDDQKPNRDHDRSHIQNATDQIALAIARRSVTSKVSRPAEHSPDTSA